MDKKSLILFIFILSKASAFSTDRYTTVKKLKEKEKYVYQIRLEKNYTKNRKIWKSYSGVNWSITMEANKNFYKSIMGKIEQEIIIFRKNKIYFINLLKTNKTNQVKVSSDTYSKLQSTIHITNSANIKESLKKQTELLIQFFPTEITKISLINSSCNKKRQGINCIFNLTLVSEEKLLSKDFLFALTNSIGDRNGRHK